ncbi:MAG TPA: FG-GAP-like repeat-containing protein [Bryobacteraceae bacterium]
MGRQRMIALAAVIAVAILLQGAHRPSRDDRIWQHRNLGKAFYENPTTQKEAVAEFRQALDLNPDSVRERLNYGLALLRAGDIDRGVTELQVVQKRDPSLPHTWFNLGVAYKKQGNVAASIEQFQGFVRLVAGEPVSHYNLGMLFHQRDDLARAVTEFETAARLDAGFAAPRFQLFNAYRAADRTADANRVLAEFRALKAKQEEPDADQEDVNWSAYSEIYDPVGDQTANPAPQPRLRYGDRTLAGQVDAKTAGVQLLDFDGDGRPDLLVWSDSGILLYRGGTELVDRGLSALRHVVWVAPGDYDNDGLVDVCVITADGVLLFRNNAGADFQPAPLPAVGSGFRRAVWIDYDHDRDLDLILLGERALLLRNDGNAGWEDRTRDIPFVAGTATSASAIRYLPDDTKAFDLLVAYEGRVGVLYRDRLNGRYEATPASDVAAQKPEFANDFIASATADFNGDGLPDVVGVAPDGSIHFAANETKRPGAWLTVSLEGVKSLKIPVAAEVEVKAGTFYERKRYENAPLMFGLGDREVVDTIRIVWPNGLIQNETRKLARLKLHVKEAPRLSGSCPMIFTWNGHEFEFITDVLGVAPLGASSGDGTYFPVDHDEYVSIPGASLVPNEGQYEIHVTEELNEVSYLDQVQLLALDHPAGTEVFTNEKWKGPPYPEFKLYGVKRRVYPRAARDDGGHDVLRAVLHRDRVYVDGFSRDVAGVAEMHALELDFGPEAARSNRAVLVLNGWVDWADGSTFLKAAQSGHPLISPSLQVKDTSGHWQTVIDDMGMPSGKTKTIAVDLTGRFLSDSREIRILTNLCVYWDEIFLGEDASAPQARLTPLNAGAAQLRFRGFSRIQVDPERKQPEAFDYATVSALSNWNPTPGRYTRYGDVRELVQAVDDRLVVMGSGDELQLWYEAASLPPLPQGWVRDFLLLVDGWAKDADANTAFSQNVEPLPFHGMSRYPYPASEAYPQDVIHQRYRDTYNTRRALRLIRPLTP